MTTGVVGMRAAALARRMTELTQSGEGDVRALVGEFRRSEVLVPVVEDSLLTVAADEVRWLFAFTGMETLDRFAEQRPETVDEWVTVFGARLLDQVIPGIGGPVGVAVDAGSPSGFVLPPVRGIVPDAVAWEPEPESEPDPEPEPDPMQAVVPDPGAGGLQ
ncbi:SseB family protein [Streptomyces sp. B-S-A8]|uniref:SseB family protein n=1 Tax=Streptomyces solicavernae TaxID=3043614 RepID=A0ABT6RPB8_9ACTN|nr:SseB family protein [Streptomyces sp. B-S-A8]MDI3385556.1 SseB family protein [Streptomyces sp. B-S-A8]